MRVCLVNPPWTVRRQVYAASPPLPLLALGTVLDRRGTEVSIIDLQRQLELRRLAADSSIFDKAVSAIDAVRPDLLGVTAYTRSAPIALRLIQHYRETSKAAAPVVLGGPAFHSVAEKVMLMFPEVDYIVRGEGEVTLEQLVHTLQQREDGEGAQHVCNIRGLVWRHSDGTVRVNRDRPPVADLDTLPLPDYSLLNAGEYFLPDNLATVDVGRGCFNRCPFCHTSRFWGNPESYRMRSTQKIVDHMEQIYRRWGVTRFVFTHDCFVQGASPIRAFRDVIAKSPLAAKIEIACAGVLARLSREIVALLSELGCVQIFIGVETGSTELAAKIDKRVNTHHLTEIVDECVRVGVRPELSYIVGLPGETESDLEATMALALRMSERGARCYLNLYSASPDTPLYDRCKDQLTYLGLFPAGTNIQKEFGIEDMVKGHPDIFPEYYNVAGEVSPRLLFAVMVHYTRLLNDFPRTFAAVYNERGGRVLDAFASFVSFVEANASAEDRASFYQKLPERNHVRDYFPQYTRSLGSSELGRLASQELEINPPRGYGARPTR